VRNLRSLVAVLVPAAAMASLGCQPSVTSQLEAGLPELAVRPATMPNEVGRDADKVGTELLDAHVPVRISVPARSVAASRTAKGGHIVAVTVTTVVDLNQSSRRYVGFKVLLQHPQAGAALVASNVLQRVPLQGHQALTHDPRPHRGPRA
jgi:hypothetical protein